MSHRYFSFVFLVGMWVGVADAQRVGFEAASAVDAWVNAVAVGVSTASTPLVGGELEEDLYGDRQAVYGYYFRGSLMGVEPVNEARAISDGQSVDTDAGFGLTAAAGYKMDVLPFAWEFEYMYRVFSHDSFTDPVAGFVNDNDVSLHTFAINAMFDQANLIGPVGVYAGGGLGFRLSSFSFSSGTGGSQSSIIGDGVFFQAMAGVTFTVDSRTQIYGGVRYTDSGTVDNDFIDIDTAAVGGEIGVRVYF